MNNTIYVEEKFHKYNIERYFNQIKGNDLLSEEEREIADEILEKLQKTCKIRSVSKVYTSSEFIVKNGELIINEVKIHWKLFEQDYFHGIISLMVFLITIYESEDSTIYNLLDQYYETIWKYAALQGHRDNIITEYKMQIGNGVFTPILGPGYYGMDLIENEKIYELLHGRELGIMLSDRKQFIPENTICGLMINMKSMKDECKDIIQNPCRYCAAAKKNCGFCNYSK
ncbi:hypothetical protein [Anaerosporobacter sp.]